MHISSRTPEGSPDHCTVCGHDLTIEPSRSTGDAPCPRCGCLIWFDLEGVRVARPAWGLIEPEWLDRLVESGDRVVIDMAEVDQVSSVVLARLIGLARRPGGPAARLRLRNVHPDLAEVFRICRIDGMIDVQD